MATLTLPDQFAWRPHAGSGALTFRGKIAGPVSPLPDDSAIIEMVAAWLVHMGVRPNDSLAGKI
ncbi:hypothetical protein ACIPR8_07150 [Stenotrophomonas sp. LARHCG68]